MKGLLSASAVQSDLSLRSGELLRAFFAIMLLRSGCMVGIIITLPVRYGLSQWMMELFKTLAYFLLIVNFPLLLFYKRVFVLLMKFPFLLSIELLIAVGIIGIGGGWRSSFIVYTMTTIILFTIFFGRKGTYFSAALLMLVALVKDPSKGLPSMEVFGTTSLDIRLGTALGYLVVGLIVGYFYHMLMRLEKMSSEEVEKTRQYAEAKEKMRLSMELHDGAKQIVTAMLLKMTPLVKNLGSMEKKVAQDLQWLWRGMAYLHSELSGIMDTLRCSEPAMTSTCNLQSLVREEVKIVEVLTGLNWDIRNESEDIFIPLSCKQPLRRFIGEAVMNASKHSASTSRYIDINQCGKCITITINDNGKGFNLTDDIFSRTSGLQNLKHRADELHGDFSIETGAGKGCQLNLTFNLPETHGNN